mgnify:CR=1 FL=1
MTPQEIIEHCDRQIELAGDTASVGFLIPGRWGKTNTRGLWKGGPIGEIVNDFGDGTIYVMFSAVEVKEAAQKLLREASGQ